VSIELLTVLGLLAAAIVMFVANRPRMDVVALMVMTALPFTGVLTMSEALAGFADGNIVLIAALFVLGDALVRTGVARRVGDWLIERTGSSEAKLLILLMVVVCTIGATMSSTAVTAIFIPVVLRIARTTGSSPGRLMMPLSMAALISGMTTLVATTPNLVVNSELTRESEELGRGAEEGFHFFAFTPFGVPILVMGIIYMLFARRWLPATAADAARASRGPSLADWIEEYRLERREHRLRITATSPLAGRTLSELDLRGCAGANILAIERSGRYSRQLIRPTSSTELLAGDVLLVDLSQTAEGIEALRDRYSLEALPLAGGYLTDQAQDLGMAEAIVTADSDLIGKTVVDGQFRTRTNLTAVGLRRDSKPVEATLSEERLRVGDTLLLVGPWRDLQRLNPGETGVAMLRLPTDLDEVLPAPGRALPAVAILLLVVAAMVTGVMPNVQAALIGCLLMGAFGCVTITSAYRCIDWKTLILIVGMLPFSIALQRTGGVDMAAEGIRALTSSMGIHGVLGLIFFTTMVLGMFISNTATAVLMAPVAIAVARELEASPQPFAMIVALAASTAFITPVSSPVNTLVVTPGNYSFGDFVKIGAPFAVIVMIFCVFFVPILLPP
jgi:di/tricarboxylate transporter